ncbi:cytochrome P450 [Streptomyces sp. NPDC097619]|uniref:cytochrome P450 n=1 Tax=Streptomyces sp. NPDC097619 TaxID=3157228 RepID=UPI0033317AB8
MTATADAPLAGAAAPTPADPTVVDLSAPAEFVPEPPHRVWAALRELPGLHWQDRPDAPGFHSVVRHDHTRTVLRDVATYSSEWGMTLDSTLGTRDPAAGLMIELTDKPRHARLRKLVTAAITPQFVQSLTPVIQGHAARLAEAAVRQEGPVDAVTALTAPMPRLTIGSILGIPVEDQERVAAMASRAITGTEAAGAATPTLAERRRCSETGNNDLLMYFVEIIEGEPHRLDPGGMVRRLMDIELDGERLTSDEVLLNCLNLAIGGYETTKNAVASGLYRLAGLPGAWQWLREDHDRVPAMIEEMLRFDTPAMHLIRTVTRPTVLGGTELKEGDTVCVWLSAANRDPAVFEAPDEFRIDRDPNNHLAFTIGPHFCLGAVLARLEMRSLFTELLTRVESLEALSAPVRRPSNFIAGIDRLDLLLHTA